MPIGNFILSLSIIIVVYALLFFAFWKSIKRSAPFVILAISFVLVALCFIFDSIYGLFLCAAFTASFLTISLMSNLGDLRSFLANPFSRAGTKATNVGIEKIYDRKALYKTIQQAVIELSNNKVGALMTFEKGTSLKDVCKNGVPIHAPVSVPLLLTIFYNGTRLHDGAVVIHGNEIVSAAVFYSPTTEPFAGKYGSRHRAAIGISEISDAITVVVSEETGRISFAVNGSLETVDQANFLRVFENYMDEEDAENE